MSTDNKTWNTHLHQTFKQIHALRGLIPSNQNEL